MDRIIDAGVLNLIKELDIIKVIEPKDDGNLVSMQYLDYVYPDKEEQPADAPMSRNTDDNEYKTMALKVYKKTVELETKKVPLTEDPEDPGNVISTYLLKKILGGISYLALRHKQEVEANTQSLDLVIEDTSDTSSRRVMSRILASANFIAGHGRRGPANTIIASQDILNFINYQPTSSYVYKPRFGLAGLNMLACNELGNTIIVMRTPNFDEPGLFLFTKNEYMPIDYNFNEAGTDITDANIKFAISNSGEKAYYNYLQFDIHFTGN